MKETIITIGDEILLGQIVDTNSCYMAHVLAQAGIETIEISSIADQSAAIIQTLDRVWAKSDVIVMTGGLGPTKDDITKKTLADYFSTELVFHEEVYRILGLFLSLFVSICFLRRYISCRRFRN